MIWGNIMKTKWKYEPSKSTKPTRPRNTSKPKRNQGNNKGQYIVEFRLRDATSTGLGGRDWKEYRSYQSMTVMDAMIDTLNRNDKWFEYRKKFDG
jgi:hypothetical protein